MVGESVLAEKSQGHHLTDGYPTLLGLQPSGVVNRQVWRALVAGKRS